MTAADDAPRTPRGTRHEERRLRFTTKEPKTLNEVSSLFRCRGNRTDTWGEIEAASTPHAQMNSKRVKDLNADLKQQNAQKETQALDSVSVVFLRI